MDIQTAIAVFKFFDPRRKPLQRLGAFLCRKRIAALESNEAILKSRLEEVERELAELQREHAAEHDRLVSIEERLSLRDKFRRVAVGSISVYALRRAAAIDGEPPRLLCPVCFERGDFVDLIWGVRRDCIAIDTFKDRAHVRCPHDRCGFRFVCAPETLRQAFKLVD